MTQRSRATHTSGPFLFSALKCLNVIADKGLEAIFSSADSVADLHSKHFPQCLLVDHRYADLLCLGELAASILTRNHVRGFA